MPPPWSPDAGGRGTFSGHDTRCSWPRGSAVHRARSPQPSIPITISRASARSGETIVPNPLTPPPSLPEDEQFPEPSEDKQELERRRLLAQASAPPTDDDDDDDEAGPSQPDHRAVEAPSAPSAPVIDEEEEYIVHALRTEASESLPQYQR